MVGSTRTIPGLTKPFWLLEGGYISWQTFDTGDVYRAVAKVAKDGPLTPKNAPFTPKQFVGEPTIEQLGAKVRPQQKPSPRIDDQWGDDRSGPARQLKGEINMFMISCHATRLCLPSRCSLRSSRGSGTTTTRHGKLR